MKHARVAAWSALAAAVLALPLPSSRLHRPRRRPLRPGPPRAGDGHARRRRAGAAVPARDGDGDRGHAGSATRLGDARLPGPVGHPLRQEEPGPGRRRAAAALVATSCRRTAAGWCRWIRRPRLLGPLLRKRAEWRAARRVLLVGEVAVPQIAVTTSVSGDAVRVTLEASEKLPFRVQQEQGRVTVAVAARPRRRGAPAGAPDRRDRRPRAVRGRARQRVLDRPRPALQEPADVRAGGPAAPGARVPGRAAATPREAGASPSPPPAAARGGRRRSAPSSSIPATAAPRSGPRGPAGTLEKDVTLAIARKLRANVANGLGLQAFLTRDRDQEVAARRPAGVRQQLQGRPVRLHPRQRVPQRGRARQRGVLPVLPGHRRREPAARGDGGRRDRAAPRSRPRAPTWR